MTKKQNQVSTDRFKPDWLKHNVSSLRLTGTYGRVSARYLCYHCVSVSSMLNLFLISKCRHATYPGSLSNPVYPSSMLKAHR